MALIQRWHLGPVEAARFGRYRLGINSSCIVYRIGDAIIDTGPPNQWRQVRRFLAETGVRDVLITHHHEDHSGNGGRIGAQFAARVCAPAAGRPALADGFQIKFYQRVIWGRPLRFESETLDDAFETAGFTLVPVATPGHSPDMTCFHAPDEGWLFSGDLYIASRTRLMRADEDLDRLMLSLERVLALDFDKLFCAHRGPVKNGREAIRRKLGYLTQLREEIRALAAEGLTTDEIVKRKLGGRSVIALITAGDMSGRNLVEACLKNDAPSDAPRDGSDA